MSFPCHVCEEMHDDPRECAVYKAMAGEDTDEDTPSGKEIRAEMGEHLATSHAGAVITIEFPREDNDVDEADFNMASFFVENDLSLTEKLAVVKTLEDSVESLYERICEKNDGRPERTIQVGAIPADEFDIGQLVSGGDDASKTEANTLGFE